MTYGYMMRAVGRNLPIREGIDWSHVVAVIPVNEAGEEIKPATEIEELRLTTRQVLSYSVKDDIVYATI